MKRARTEDTDREATKKFKALPSHHLLHERLRTLGLSIKGNKQDMIERLALYRLRKFQLVEKVLEMCPDINVPRIGKKELVMLIPKIRKADEMTVDELKHKLQRMHHYVHEMPSETASKLKHIEAYAEALMYKSVGLHAESDEEGEIDLLARKTDLLHQLNTFDKKNIHFSPNMTKSDLIHAYQKYILHPRGLTKDEIHAQLEEKYPQHLPLSHCKKNEFHRALAVAMYEEEYGAKVCDDPSMLHVSDIKERLAGKGIMLHTGLHRDALEELYDIFVYDRVGHMTKRNIRDFLNKNDVKHGLTAQDKKSAHVEAFYNFFKAKHNIEN